MADGRFVTTFQFPMGAWYYPGTIHRFAATIYDLLLCMKNGNTATSAAILRMMEKNCISPQSDTAVKRVFFLLEKFCFRSPDNTWAIASFFDGQTFVASDGKHWISRQWDTTGNQ